MAKVDILFTRTEGTLLFYNVERAVGPGCVNNRNDVLLVQYLLREAFKTPFFSRDPLAGFAGLTGLADQMTLAAIMHFQRGLRKERAVLSAADGRIDPAGTDPISSISHTQYTIINLNLAYQTRRPNEYPIIAQAADCPAELRVALKPPRFLTN